MSHYDLPPGRVWAEFGGSGEPVLLLCHGMSGNGGVWDGLRPHLDAKWPGRWIVPDLRGHGRSDHAPGYGIAQQAGDLAALVQDALNQQDGPVLVCGHSLGGLLAMTLASGWFGFAVSHAIAVGTKVSWKDGELAQSVKLAATPTRWFETREEAAERFLRVSGLEGLVAPDAPVVAHGIAEYDGRWRLAADNRTALVAGADTPEIFGLAQQHSDVVLAAGGNDWMVPADELRTLSPDAVVLEGLGHNAHVEDPAQIWRLIAESASV